MSTTVQKDGTVVSRCCARIGLLGNPSDGYGGAVMALSLANFAAEVTLCPSPTLRFEPNPEHDPQEFAGLQGLASHIRSRGFYGGVRILQATCLRFFEHCKQHSIPLDGAGPFTLSYTTDIPRQCGLSGSSALACATLSCLLRHHGVEAAVPAALRPQLVLEAEQLLGITAGLQDRVVQVYGGLLFMDFSPALDGSRPGCGRYEALDPGLLPPFHLIYDACPPAEGKDSGAVHSDVRQRWLAGDEEARTIMARIAALAHQGRDALLQRDLAQLAALMNTNLSLRRQLFGDAVVGAASLAMAEVAASVGAAAKLTGSGGAVVALCPGGEEQVAALRAACAARGLECMPIVVGPQLHDPARGNS
ncbi:hypothetical protein ABPG75_006118 [Micractinium tetrahymenae]